MNNNKARIAFTFVALQAVTGAATAQLVTNDGYARDAAGYVVKDPFGLCWRTSQWTPAKAIPECDPALAPKPAPRLAAPAPAPAPAPVVAAPPPPPPPAPAPVAAPAPKPAPAPVVAAPPPPPPPAPAPVQPRVENITLGADASFDTGRADLKPEGRAKLDELADKLKGVRIDSIVLTGHTDSVGRADANQRLSLRRADAVKAYLASRGVDAAKIQTVGRGAAEPVADNRTAQGRAANRRVEVEIKGARPL